MEVTVVIAVTLSVIGGLVSAYATIRQRRTEDATLIVGAMQKHMELLTAENGDLRTRVRHAEVTISDLRVEVANCNADKFKQQVELNELKRRVTGIEGSQDL